MPGRPWHQATAEYAPLVLRVGMAAVILWFGINELTSPDNWTSWVPDYVTAFGVTPYQVVVLNGFLELALGLMLLLGVYTRLVSAVLFVHMAVLVYEFGMTPVGVRDFGLALGLLSLALDTRSKWSIL